MAVADCFDIAVGFVLPKGAEPSKSLVEKISAGLSAYFSTFRWILVHTHAGLPRGERPLDLPDVENQIPVSVPWAGIQHVTFPWHGIPAKTAGYQALLTESERAGASVCLIVDPSEEGFEPAWVDALVRPGLHSRYDIVTPVYPARLDRRMISANLISPLLRGLFGSGPREPMSGTFLVSGNFRRRLLSRRDWDGGPARYVPELWMNFSAAAEGYRRAEAFVGPSRSSLPGAILPPHLALIQIVESLFSLMEQYEDHWRKGITSGPLDRFGRAERMPLTPSAPDGGLDYLVRFVHACPALRQQWRAVLHPQTCLAIDSFYSALQAGSTEASLSGASWARIVCEMAGAWRCRVRPRHQLAGLFVPLYWARIGSVLLESRLTEPCAADGRTEVLDNEFQRLQPVLDRLWGGEREAL